MGDTLLWAMTWGAPIYAPVVVWLSLAALGIPIPEPTRIDEED